MSWTVIIVLIVIGLLFLLLEVLVVPGTTVVGILGFILMIIGIWQAYTLYGRPAGHYTVGATVLATVLILTFALKSKTWKRMMLKTEIDGRVNVIEESKVKVGDNGITISRIAPAGNARVNGVIYEVHSTGAFIDQGSEILIVKIDQNILFVKLKI
ncbi:MAG: NfeD family protein [Bacteroidales bacterium]|nr:NfeD family protein [Bacteroidales bacterium]